MMVMAMMMMMLMMLAMAMALTFAMMMMLVAVMVMVMIARPLPEELATVSRQSTRLFPGAVVGPDTCSLTAIIIIMLSRLLLCLLYPLSDRHTGRVVFLRRAWTACWDQTHAWPPPFFQLGHSVNEQIPVGRIRSSLLLPHMFQPLALEGGQDLHPIMV